MDLDPGNVRPAEWSALVRRDRVELLVEQTGAELVADPAPWNGAPFGDGGGGTVELLNGEVVGDGLNRSALA